VDHKDARLGAALAYYSIFSVGPLVLIAIAVAGLLFGQDAVRGEVSAQMQGLLGNSGAQAVESMLADASRPREGIFAIVFGVGALLFAAIGLVVQLKDALNTVWGVEIKKSGVWQFIRTYLVSLAGVLSLGFLLLVSLLVSTVLAAGSKSLAPYLPEALLQVVSSAVSFAFITVLFAMMFKWLPDAEVAWRDVWAGAAVTALLFEIGKFLIGLYIGNQGLESTFGAAASGGVRSKKGKHVSADHALSAAPSIFFDAVALLPSVEGGGLMAREAAAVDWLRDAFGHLKVIGHVEGATPLFEKAAIPVDADDGVVGLVGNLPAFIKAAKKHRVWEREPTLRTRG